MMQIKAVLFDFDNTLGNRMVYAYNTYREMIEQYTAEKDPVAQEAMVQDCMLWDEFGNIDKNYVKDSLETKYGIRLPFANMNTYWEANQWKTAVLFDHVMETLQALKKEYLLGCVSNGDAGCQRNKLRVCGLADFFDTTVVSGEEPWEKPDPRIFRKALDQISVKPEEAVFVGDSFANDVLGSYRAGMHPIWIWPSADRPCQCKIPVIRHISELPGLLYIRSERK